ncbi:aminoadipate-semialdehyde dehydrogenase [Glossina fuscipes fuscipes]
MVISYKIIMEEKCYEIKNLRKFCKNIFIYQRFDENNEEVFSYENILKAVDEVLEYFHQHAIEKKVGIGIHMPENSVEGCVLLLSILNNDCRFYGFNDESDSSLNRSVKSSEIAYVFLKKPVEFEEIYQCYLPKLNVLNSSYFVIKLKTSTLSLKNLPLCYSIATSGSTGESKLVHVPYKCIQPNIASLSSLLKIETSDVIFLGSPITFDPFVIELFLALANGAALLITSTKTRLSPNHLHHVLFPSLPFGLKGVSIFQTTPSLFRLFGKEIIRNVIFDKTNTLRCLILGGEEFPSYAELLDWLPQTTNQLFNKRVFNIYGITEVSCWSTICEVNFHSSSSTECSIPLGDALDNETVLRIVDEKGKVLADDAAVGELQICSTTRRCYVPQCDQHPIPIRQEDSITFRNTGDLVKRASDGNVYYLGRLDNTVKRLGKRLCLDSLSQKIENIFRKGNITNRVLCLWNEEVKKLILCLEIGQTESIVKGPLLQELLRDSLDTFEQPDKIYNLQKVPLTAHGKVNRFQLIKIVKAWEEKEHKTPLQIFKEFLQNIMGINEEMLTNNIQDIGEYTTKRSKLTTNLSFSHAGGTSFQALSLATEIDSILPQSVDQRNLLEMLLNTNVTINDIMKFLSNLAERRIEVPATLPFTRNLFKLVWSVNLHKCVDASPSLYEENVVAVGSHSHLLMVLNANNGEEISKLTLMDRIESSVLFVTNQLAMVGAHDGFLYAFDFQQGSIKWRTNVGGTIKAKPLQISDILVVASYAEDFNLLAVSLKDVTTKWRLKIGSKGIFSSPLKVDEKLCLICTLDGTYCLLRSDDGSLVWSHQMKSPIFSTPALVKSSTQSWIAIAEVRGEISICEAKSGQTISTFTADGNIFSSFAVHNQDLKHTYLIFGCYDKNVYCLNFTSTSCKLSLTWKISLDAPIYSTPILLYRTQDNEPDVLICATNGLMILANLKTALQHSSYNLEAEIFSTPCSASNGKRIFVGSRNNYLQAFQIE